MFYLPVIFIFLFEVLITRDAFSVFQKLNFGCLFKTEDRVVKHKSCFFVSQVDLVGIFIHVKNYFGFRTVLVVRHCEKLRRVLRVIILDVLDICNRLNKRASAHSTALKFLKGLVCLTFGHRKIGFH